MNNTKPKKFGAAGFPRNSSSFVGVFEIEMEDVHSDELVLDLKSPPVGECNGNIILNTRDQGCGDIVLGNASLTDVSRNSETSIKAETTATRSWFEMVANGNVEQIEKQLTDGVDVNAVNETGQTAVHLSIEANNTQLLQLLVSAGASVNLVGANGLSPLHLAAKMGRPDAVRCLVAHGADVTAVLGDGSTPLHGACQSGSGSESAKILLEAAPDMKHAVRCDKSGQTGITALHDAAEFNDLLTVELLLNNSLDANTATSAGFTSLHVAAKFGCIDVIGALLSHGALIDIPANDIKGSGSGILPLHLAVENNHTDVVLALLGAGADVNATRSTNSGRERVSCVHLAAMKRNVEMLRTLLAVPSIVISARDSDDATALHIAARCGFTDVTQMLLKAGIEVDVGMMSGNSCGHTALHSAVRYKHQELARMLIRAGANVNATEKVTMPESKPSTPGEQIDGGQQEDGTPHLVDGYTALHWAVENGDLDMVCLLLDNGADPNIAASFDKHSGVTALHLASQDGYCNIVSELLRVPGCIHDPLKRTENRDNITPLHQAVYNGHADTARLLIESGCDINRQADNGYSALHYAAQQGNAELTRLMLKRGGDVRLVANAGDQQSITCLHLAVQSGNTDVIRALLDAGASIDAGKTMGNVNGVTALHQAVYQEKLDVVQALLECGASVNASMGGWYTPLHIAAEKGAKAVAAELLKFGADVNARAKLQEHTNLTPLHVAAQQGNTEFVSFLISNGADIEAIRSFADRWSITALQLAAENGFAETVEILLDHGADVNARDSMGFTALHLAVQYGYPDAVRILIRAGCNTKLKTVGGLTASKMAEQSDSVDVLRAYKDEKKKTASRRNRRSEIPEAKSKKRRSRMMRFLCGIDKSS